MSFELLGVSWKGMLQERLALCVLCQSSGFSVGVIVSADEMSTRPHDTMQCCWLLLQWSPCMRFALFHQAATCCRVGNCAAAAAEEAQRELADRFSGGERATTSYLDVSDSARHMPTRDSSVGGLS